MMLVTVRVNPIENGIEENMNSVQDYSCLLVAYALEEGMNPLLPALCLITR